MEKQLKKAEHLINNPSKTKKTKFLKNIEKNKYEINNELKEKTSLLLGIKGYYTNLDRKITDQEVVSHYNNSWHVEQAFRIAKNDLETRPIYHFKETAIRVHLLICFMALAVSKYLELKTNISIKKTTNSLLNVTDAKIFDPFTNKTYILRSQIPDSTLKILSSLGLSY